MSRALNSERLNSERLNSERLMSERQTSFASLAMYDLPELKAHNDNLWKAIFERLVEAGIFDAPAELTRTDIALHDLWGSPNLFIAQTCGYPLIKSLSEYVQIVATPRYNALGCRGANHRSAIVVNKDSGACALQDLQNGRCAINEASSNTGMNLFREKIAPLAKEGVFFSSVKLTGSHLASLKLVATDVVDVAAIDCVTFEHFKRHYPALTSSVQVLDWTEESPGLPIVTTKNTSNDLVQTMQEIFRSIESDRSLVETRTALLLDGFEFLTLTDYQRVSDAERGAVALNYSVLQ